MVCTDDRTLRTLTMPAIKADAGTCDDLSLERPADESAGQPLCRLMLQDAPIVHPRLEDEEEEEEDEFEYFDDDEEEDDELDEEDEFEEDEFDDEEEEEDDEDDEDF